MVTCPTAEYGSWKSPIMSDLVAGEAIRLAPPMLSEGLVYWSEGRPTERGRNVIVRREADGSLHDLNPPPFNAPLRSSSSPEPIGCSVEKSAAPRSEPHVLPARPLLRLSHAGGRLLNPLAAGDLPRLVRAGAF